MRELKKGIAVEGEHRDVYEAMRHGKIKNALQFYTMIAKAHLKEDPLYYSKLEALESPAIKLPGTSKIKVFTLLEG